MKSFFFTLFISVVLAADDKVDLATCTANPNDPKCSSFSMDIASVNKTLTSLCGDNLSSIGCSVRRYCDEAADIAKSPYCHPFSLLADICTKDKKEDPLCKDYNGLCVPGTGKYTAVAQCSANKPIPDLISAEDLSKAVLSICSDPDHHMPSCDKMGCPKKKDDANFANCDKITDLRNVCNQMDMQECKGWNTMCKTSERFGPICGDVTISSPKKSKSQQPSKDEEKSNSSDARVFGPISSIGLVLTFVSLII